jgi:hypothetical protein
MTFLCFSILTTAQKINKHTVYFEVDQYYLTADERTSLDDFILQQKSRSHDFSVRITGHTDSDASNDYNMKLSEKRVRNVALYFKDIVANDRVHLDWLGEENPLNNNAGKEEKKLNRRVEIVVEHYVPDRVEDTGDIKELYKMLEQKKQRFCIHPKGDTTLVLDQGTIIYFPPEPFGKLDIPCIEIRAKEFYRKSDMILENLSTTSNGRLLESDGMVYIEATVKDQTLELKDGKKVIVLMPADSIRKDMQGFNGVRDPHSEIIDWQTNADNDFTGLSVPPGAPCYDFGRPPTPINCDRCKFFFCRIKRFDEALEGMSSRAKRTDNKDFRRCQRKIRRMRNDISVPINWEDSDLQRCAELDSLFKAYGVNNREELMVAMNKDLMDKYGVKTLAELQDTLRKEKIAKIESNLMSGNLNQSDLRYYLYNSNQLGWINTDAFSKLTGERITMTTNLEIDKQTDCKVAFKGVRGILPSGTTETNFSFYNVPENNDCWLIGMRFRNGKVYLSMKKTQTTKKVEMAPFIEVTLDELKKALSVLD